MKSSKLNELLTTNKIEVDYTNKIVSVNIIYKGYYIISSVDVSNDKYDIETDVNLTEFQEDCIINHLIDFWNMSFSNSFFSEITEQDKLNALELLYKNN